MNETGELSPKAGFLSDPSVVLPGLIRSPHRGLRGIEPVPLP